MIKKKSILISLLAIVGMTLPAPAAPLGYGIYRSVCTAPCPTNPCKPPYPKSRGVCVGVIFGYLDLVSMLQKALGTQDVCFPQKNATQQVVEHVILQIPQEKRFFKTAYEFVAAQTRGKLACKSRQPLINQGLRSNPEALTLSELVSYCRLNQNDPGFDAAWRPFEIGLCEAYVETVHQMNLHLMRLSPEKAKGAGVCVEKEKDPFAFRRQFLKFSEKYKDADKILATSVLSNFFAATYQCRS